ncbi:MAG: protein-glutamate O-methyltransferase CheR [Nitrospinota bacterium]|nr:protein-glutamate O-methyltransferase CheR [Nitrospinota bacterium]
MDKVMDITEKEFADITAYIYRICGLDINESKKYLVRQRLEPLLAAHGYESFSELNRTLLVRENADLRDQIISAITTNETSFFRDIHPFEAFKAHLAPKLAELVVNRKSHVYQRKGPKVKIWCAASSTGQEPYSIAMILSDYIENHRGNGVTLDDFSILASDISPKVLARAVAGEFTDLESDRGLNALQKAKYLNRVGNLWQLKPYLQRMVEFRRINLTESFSNLGAYDIIFCRNVLIYFDDITKKKIFSQFSKILNASGLLILGVTENLYGLSDDFESVRYGNSIFYKSKVKERVGETVL